MDWHGDRVLVTKDGLVKPLTEDERWANVQGWYEYLENERGSDMPCVEFNDAWERLDSGYQYMGKSIHERGEAGRAAATPLETLFYNVEMGFYPPPEVLLALLDEWQSYRAADGNMSLEQAFLGRTVQKAGNSAKRFNSRIRKMRRQWEFAQHLDNGKTREEAAEAVANIAGSPTVDSIMREMRGVTGLKSIIKRQEK